MTINLPAAMAFMATHARVLDRRRFELLLGHGDSAAVLAAVDAYRNPDGGFGWGLEADQRSTGSQPGGALHAFEVFEDVAPVVTPRALELCDWLASVSLPDGGLPFALPASDTAGLAPFWAQADPTVSSLQITAFVAATAQRVAAFDPATASHPWLNQATGYCLGAIERLGDAPHALVLTAALLFLDAVQDTRPDMAALGRLRKLIPSSGLLHVEGGTDEETIRPLDYAPNANRPLRSLLNPKLISADLQRLIDGQQDDGGWRVDFANYSPAAELDWRGYMTLRAVTILKRNSRL